jgi:hypothetical protein
MKLCGHDYIWIIRHFCDDEGIGIIIRFMIFGVTSWVVFIRKTLGQQASETELLHLLPFTTTELSLELISR